jgi:hypothetical protein
MDGLLLATAPAMPGQRGSRATTIKDCDARWILSRDLSVSKTPAAYLLKQQQEMPARAVPSLCYLLQWKRHSECGGLRHIERELLAIFDRWFNATIWRVHVKTVVTNPPSVSGFMEKMMRQF